MRFKKFVPTKNGLELVAKAIANKKDIIFKKISCGAGIWSVDDLKNASQLKDERQFSLIDQVDILDETTLKCGASISNDNLESGYDISEIGIFIEVDGEEVLYSIAIADEKINMPTQEEAGFYQIKIVFYQNVSSTSQSRIVVSNESFITKELFIEWKEDVKNIINDTNQKISTERNRINNILNELDRKYETLWSGTLNTVGSSISLSDDVSNYDFLEIYTSGNDRYAKRFKAGNGSFSFSSQNIPDNSAAQDFMDMGEMVLSIANGSELTITRGRTVRWIDGSFQIFENECEGISKVVGIKCGVPGNPEVSDLRVGADGEIYDTAGEAVRTQFKNIKEQHETDVSGLKGDLDEIFCRNLYGGSPNVLYPCDIPNGSKVTISTEDNSEITTDITINLYRADKTRADYWGLQNYSTRTITTNAEIKYISLTANHITGIQVEVGAEKTAYQKYFLTPKGLTNVLLNITDDDKVKAITNRSKMFCGNIEKHIVYGFLKASDGGINTDTATSQITDFVSVVPNEVIWYSGNGSASVANACFYDNDLAFISSVTPVSGEASPMVKEITVPNNAYFAKFASRSNGDNYIQELIVTPKQDEMYVNALSKKHWYACGDSFTEGAYVFGDYNPHDKYFEKGKYANKLKNYPHYIGNRTNCNVHNIAISGSTLAYVSSQDRKYSFSADLYKTIPNDADYITLWFGINDSAYSVPIGTDVDTVNTTFKGAWNVVLEYLLEHCPKAHIGIIVSNNLSKTYVDATIEMAIRWGIPYLNLNDDNVPMMQATLQNASAKAKEIAISKYAISETNMHPNYFGHEFESRFIENWMLGI